MNENTEKNINEAIDWLQQVGGSVQDFAVEQAPLYCREVVAWELGIGAFWTAIALILISIALYFYKLSRAAHKRGAEDPMMGWMFSGTVILVVGAWSLTYGAPKAIKAAVAPRLVIVEHLRGLK